MTFRPRVAHSRLLVSTTLAGALAVTWACSSDSAVKPGNNGGLRIEADSLLSVGDTLHYRAVVTNAADSVIATPAVVATPLDPNVAVRFSANSPIQARNAGVTQVTFQVAGYSEPVVTQLRVKDDRPVVALALGQTVTGHVARNFGTVRYTLSLAAGDTVDFMFESPTGVAYRTWRSLDTSLPLTATLGGTYGPRQIYAAVVAPVAGTYSFDGTGVPACTRGVCTDASGDFTLKVRRSAPVFTIVNTQRGLPPVPSGGSAVDSIYVQNLGAGTMVVRGEAIDPSITVEVAAALAKGPTTMQPAGIIPPGAAPIVVRISSNDAPGTPQSGGRVRLQLDSSTWSLLTSDFAVQQYPVVVYDPTIQLISRQYFDDVTVPASGPIYAIAGPRAYAIDRASGATTKLRDGLRNFQEILSSADGKVYLHYFFDYQADTISQLNVDGTLTPVFGFTDRNLAVATVRDDGTMYVVQGGTLRSRTAAGVVTTLATGIAPDNGAMVYSAVDNALYYVTAAVLRRFDLATLAETARGSVAAGLRLKAVDKKGRLIGLTPAYSQFVQFFGTDGTLLRTLAPPSNTTTIDVRGDTLYGSGPPNPSVNFLWKAPVP